MNKSFRRLFFALLAMGLVGASVLAEDSTPKTDWSQYVAVSAVTAEVRSVDRNSVTLRVYYMEAEVVKNDNKNDGKNNNGKNNNNGPNRNNNNKNNNGKNNNGKNNNGRGNQPNPLQRLQQQARNNQQRIQYHQEHHDYDVEFFADTTVTGKVASSTQDEKGKPAPATPADLTPGMVVQAVIIRDKSIPPANLSEKHLKLRGLSVVGTNPNYKKDPAKADPKKN